MTRIFICNKASYVFQVAVFLLMLPSGQGVLDSDSAPNIMLKGRQLTADMSFVYLLECSTLNTFHGCSVEMLLNNVTKETIRYSNYTCYNGKGICSPLQCTCSNECNKFSWNYTVTEELKHQIFKCDSRIQDKNYFYKVFASGFFKEGDFVDLQYAFEIVSKDQSGSHKVLTDKESTVTTVSKGQQNNSMYSDITNLITAVICMVSLNGINCIIIILVFCNMCIQRSKDMKDAKKEPDAKDIIDILLKNNRLLAMVDCHMSSIHSYDVFYGQRSRKLRAEYIDKLDGAILHTCFDDSDRRMTFAQYKDLLKFRKLLVEYDDMLERRRLLDEYNDKLNRRTSHAQYDEISQDEDSNDEESEEKYLSRKSAKPCRYTTDMSCRETRSSNTKVKHTKSQHDYWHQSDEIDESPTFKKNKRKIKEKASRSGLARKFHQRR